MAMMRWDDMTWDQKYAWYNVNQPKPWNPKSARAIRFKSCNRAPDSQLTKGYVKQAKKDKRQFGGLSLREMQKAAHKLQRRENQREIASGLLDHELEVQKYWDPLDQEIQDLLDLDRRLFAEYELASQEADLSFLESKLLQVEADTFGDQIESDIKKWYYTHAGD